MTKRIGCNYVTVDESLLRQVLEALDEADTFHRFLPDQRARRLASMTALRSALDGDAVEPVVFYRCNGCDHAYETSAPSSCDCMEGTRFERVEYVTAPQPAQKMEPVLFIHPDTLAMNAAHVGAWKPGHELEGYIPLYMKPPANIKEQS